MQTINVLWSVLLYSLALQGAVLIVRCQLFTNIGLHNLLFTDHVLFTWSSKSLLHCSHMCGVKATCLTFTFCPPICQGHYDIMTADSSKTSSIGCRSYVRRNTAVRCHESEGVQTVAVPGLGIRNIVCNDEWIVILRRKDGHVDFYRNWNSYANGFGNLTGEFWLGLESMHYVTKACGYTLKVILGDWEGNFTDALFSNFSVGPSQTGYALSELSFVTGTANDSLSWFNGTKFTTYDRDQDSHVKKNCASKHRGAWWYKSCVAANLCGVYYSFSNVINKTGITWKSWHGTTYSLKFAQLQMQPDPSC